MLLAVEQEELGWRARAAAAQGYHLNVGSQSDIWVGQDVVQDGAVVQHVVAVGDVTQHSNIVLVQDIVQAHDLDGRVIERVNADVVQRVGDHGVDDAGQHRAT